jgi:hypothetical protein
MMAAAANQSNETKSRSGFDTTAVVLLTLAALLFVFALSLFLRGGFLSAQAVDHRAKLDLSGDPALEVHLAEQKDLLTTQPAWLDQEAGRVSVPIDMAKERLVENLGQQEAGADHE